MIPPIVFIHFNNNQTVIFKMGNNSSDSLPTQMYESGQNIEHPHLGTIKTSTNPKFPQCFHKIYHFADELMGQQKLRRFNARVKKFANSQYILSIKSAMIVQKHEMCSHNCEVHLYFEKYSHSLKQIIAARLKEKRNFSQQEIYQFLNKVLSALIFLQDNGFKNCLLDKDSIVISQGRVKLLDLGIATSNPFQNFLDKLQPVEGFYVAPELLKDLKQKNYQPYLSPKSDVFCLGMIILELACLEPLDNYYNFEDLTIDYESLIHRVSRIVYSVQLKTLIAGMLQFQSDMRLGLITAQEKVRKALHLDTLQQNCSSNTKRSRSSSTKMLKQLLTNSRRTNTASHKQSDKKSLTKKPSNSSLTSMASLNSRHSFLKSFDERVQQSKKQNELYPSKQQTNFLKDLVRTKTEVYKTVPVAQTQPKQMKLQIDENKENNNFLINKQVKIKITQPSPEFKDSLKIIQQARNQSFGGSTFLANDCQFENRKFQSATPKISEYLDRINRNKQQSIFRLIQQDSNSGSNGSNKSKTGNTGNTGNTTRNVPNYSPVPPVIPKVQQTNSIRREQCTEQPVRQVTQFDAQVKKDQGRKNNLQLLSPDQSLSLRVKKSLDKMYKTTQSIINSQEKSQQKQNTKNIYKKVYLPNNYLYEGEVRQDEMFEGNGVLYDPKGRVVYSGSWAQGLYEGYGTIFNMQQLNSLKIDHKNLDNATNWIKYEGEFVKGQRQGFGTIYYSSGQKFAGCMRNGQVNGYGCFYNNFNEMTSGIWVNNRLQS